MVDCITQWVLKPLHEFIFSILKTIPQDGTFDQKRAVREIQSLIREGHNHVFSFDLTAATDRLPIALQKLLLNFLCEGLGDHWSNLLINRDYRCTVPALKHKKATIKLRYKVGQPMGAYSS
jgi:hypothetical protein